MISCKNHVRHFVGLLTRAWSSSLPSPVCSAFSGYVPNGELSLTSSGHHAYSGGYRPGFSPDSLVQPLVSLRGHKKLNCKKSAVFPFWKDHTYIKTVYDFQKALWMYDHCRLTSLDEHGLGAGFPPACDKEHLFRNKFLIVSVSYFILGYYTSSLCVLQA